MLSLIYNTHQQSRNIIASRKYPTFEEVNNGMKELQEKFQNIKFERVKIGDFIRIPRQWGIQASSNNETYLKSVPDNYKSILIIKKISKI